ncbi:LADA_0H09956g1_1 [Lachancea dasiensis]|uniref:LADA_0H09956g1_1 n=1 Tax=Lachancea dasiensis TaxID=1072105 RepID=A0A1G4K2X9_9SACH|nr:LADA_0H09956g1_1 [Lachancea dasiensis]
MSLAAVADRGALLSQQRDYNHATDSEYKRLRQLADGAYTKRQQLSQQSQKAFKNGDKGQAHTLSEKAKEQLSVAEKYNMQAAEYVFTQNNADSDSNEIDLHGLYTKEAQWILQKRIAVGVSNHESSLEVIVGKGLHSANGIAKIKPAVEELCQQVHLRNYVDPKNAGVLVIELQNAQVPSSWATMDYSTFAHNGPSKPAQAYQPHGVSQQQPHNNYAQQQQPQYKPQQYQQHQQQHYNQSQGQNNNANNSSQNNDIINMAMKLLCMCVRKNL